MANNSQSDRDLLNDEEVIENLDLLLQMDLVEDEESWNMIGDSEFIESALNDERKKE